MKRLGEGIDVSLSSSSNCSPNSQSSNGEQELPEFNLFNSEEFRGIEHALIDAESVDIHVDNEYDVDLIEEQWLKGSEPSLEDVLIGLTDEVKQFSNQLQLSESVRLNLIRQAEMTGHRGLEWTLQSFDKV